MTTHFSVACSPQRLAHLLLVPVLIVAGCSRTAAVPNAQTKDAAKGPPSVTLVKPVTKTLVHRIEQPGEIQAFEQTSIYPKISGYVMKVHKDIDDPVEKGDVLAELTVPEMDVDLTQKQSLVTQAEAELQLAKDMVAVADAELSRMKSQFERFNKLGATVLDKEAIAESQFGFETSKAKRSMAQSDVAVKAARVEVAKNNRDHVKALLQYAILRAPYKGIVVQRHVNTGDFVQPLSGGKREPLFAVAQMDPVRIFVDVPEADALDVKKGAKADVRIEAAKGQTFSGTVTRSAWGLDPKARTLRTEIDLKNEGGRLRPGMYAHSSIVVEHPGVLALPATAVVTHADQRFCFRAESGKAVRVPVKAGVIDGGFVEVFMKQKPGKDGAWEKVTQDDEFIRDAASLTDGQEVVVGKGD